MGAKFDHRGGCAKPLFGYNSDLTNQTKDLTSWYGEMSGATVTTHLAFWKGWTLDWCFGLDWAQSALCH